VDRFAVCEKHHSQEAILRLGNLRARSISLTYAYLIYIVPNGDRIQRLEVRGKSEEARSLVSEAQAVLFDPLAVTIEDLSAIGERRYVTVGLASSGELLVVVYAERNRGYRLISARKATPKERKTYER